MALSSISVNSVIRPNLGQLLRQTFKSQASAKAHFIYYKTERSAISGNVPWWSHHFYYMYNLMPPMIVNDINSSELQFDIFDNEYNHSYDKLKLGQIMKDAAIQIETRKSWNENHINDIIECLQFNNSEEKEYAKHKLLKTANS